MMTSLRNLARWALPAALAAVSLCAAAADKYPVVLRLENDTQVSGDLVRYADGYFELQTERGVLRIRQDHVFTVDFGVKPKVVRETWKPEDKGRARLIKDLAQKLLTMPKSPDTVRWQIVELKGQANKRNDPDLVVQVLEEAIHSATGFEHRLQRWNLMRELQEEYAARGDIAKVRELEPKIREDEPFVQKLLRERRDIGPRGHKSPP